MTRKSSAFGSKRLRSRLVQLRAWVAAEVALEALVRPLQVEAWAAGTCSAAAVQGVRLLRAERCRVLEELEGWEEN